MSPMPKSALADDKSLKKAECKTGVGKECKKVARAGRETLATTLELRKQYADTKEPPEDRTAERLSALTGGYLSKERIETFQPMLVPVSVSFLAGLLITLALEVEMPGAHKRAPTPERTRWRWPAWRRKAEAPSPVVAPAVIDVEPQRAPEPAPEAYAAPACQSDRGRGLPPPRASPSGLCSTSCTRPWRSWTARRGSRCPTPTSATPHGARAKSLRPMEADEFFNEMADHCAQFGIPIQEEAGCVYLGNVRLMSSAKASEGP